MVIAICPICKKKIEVDFKMPASICSECGQPIITEQAIKEYMQSEFGHLITASAEVEAAPAPAPEPISDPTFLIEDGELTKYKGNKREVKIPLGVKGIGSNAFDCHVEKIFVPESVEYLNRCSLYGQVEFADGCVLKKIEPGAFQNVTVIENVPVMTNECTQVPGAFKRDSYQPLIFLCKRSEKEFFAEYPYDDVKYYQLYNYVPSLRQKMPNPMFFEFEKYVVTRDGWKIVVCKNDAYIIGYVGTPCEILRAPSEYDGRVITTLALNYLSCGANSIKEFYLPEKLLKLKKGTFLLKFAQKVFLPSSLKYIAAGSINCDKVCFEKRNGIQYSEIEEIESGALAENQLEDLIIAPYFKKAHGSSSHFKTQEEYDKEIALREEKKQYDSEKRTVRFISQIYKDGSLATITVTDKYGKTEYKLAHKDVNHHVDVLLHEQDDAVVSIYNPFCLTTPQNVPKGITECTVKETFLSWKLICK